MTFYNTIDLDKVDKQQLADIVSKITAKPCCLSLQYKDSSSKGYHISIVCSKQCDVCRMVFDDQKRFEMDSNRDIKFQNTLFTEKEPIHTNLRHISDKCDRCAKYGKVSTLNHKELSPDEMLKKLKDGKIKLPITIFGRKATVTAFIMGYDYFECPICRWFKFVKRKQ
jgi:hypothetical protein